MEDLNLNEMQLASKPKIYNSVYYAFIFALDLILMCLFYRTIDSQSGNAMHDLIKHMAGSSLLFALNMLAVMLVHYFSKLAIPAIQDAGYFRFSTVYSLITEGFLQLSFFLFIIYIILIGRFKDSASDEQDIKHITKVISSERTASVFEFVFAAIAFVSYVFCDIYYYRCRLRVDIFDKERFFKNLPFVSLLTQAQKIEIFYNNQNKFNERIHKFNYLHSDLEGEEFDSVGIENEILKIRDDVETMKLTNARCTSELKNLRVRIAELKGVQQQLQVGAV